MAVHAPFTLITGSWQQVGDHAGKLRHQVFVIEQQVPVELELDEHDATAVHALVFAGSAPIGTGRLLPDGHIGRMAVLQPYRGQGVGTMLLSALIQQARGRGDQDVVLAAQCHAQGFYNTQGFSVEGGVFMDAGIPHVLMRKTLR